MSQKENLVQCKYLCPIDNCNATFQHRSALSRHVAKFHSELKGDIKRVQYIQCFQKGYQPCPECYRPFKNSESLRKHKKLCQRAADDMAFELLNEQFPQKLQALQRQDQQAEQANDDSIQILEVEAIENQVQEGLQEVQEKSNQLSQPAPPLLIQQVQCQGVSYNQAEHFNEDQSIRDLGSPSRGSLTETSYTNDFAHQAIDFQSRVNQIQSIVQKQCQELVIKAALEMKEILNNDNFEVYYIAPAIQAVPLQIKNKQSPEQQPSAQKPQYVIPKTLLKNLVESVQQKQENYLRMISSPHPHSVNLVSPYNDKGQLTVQHKRQSFIENITSLVKHEFKEQRLVSNLEESKQEPQPSVNADTKVSEVLNRILKDLKYQSNINSSNLFVEKPKTVASAEARVERNLRSNTLIEEGSLLKGNNNVSVTHGEITFGSVNSIVKTFKEYGMNQNSVVVDLGSSFGQVVFQIAFQENLHCQGVEIVDSRISIAQQVLDKYNVQFESNAEVQERLNKVHFNKSSIENLKRLEVSTKLPITHVYSYSARMTKSTKTAIVNLINRSPEVQVLLWNCNEKDTIIKFGLKDFEYTHYKVNLHMQGSHQGHTFFCYQRIKSTLKRDKKKEIIKLVDDKSGEIAEQSSSKLSSLTPSNKLQQNKSSKSNISKSNRSSVNTQQEQLSSNMQWGKQSRYTHRSNLDVYQPAKKRICLEVKPIDSSQLKTLIGEIKDERQKAADAIQQMMQRADQYKVGLRQMKVLFNNVEVDQSIQVPEYKKSLSQSLASYQIDSLERNFANQYVLDNIPHEIKDRLFVAYAYYSKVKELQQVCEGQCISQFQKGYKYKQRAKKLQSLNLKLHDQLEQYFKKEVSNNGITLFYKLGSGSFGNVYKCHWHPQGSNWKGKHNKGHYAIKLPVINDNGQNKNEVCALNTIHGGQAYSKNFIVKPEAYINFFGSKAILMQEYPHTLSQLIKKSHFKEAQVMHLSYCILMAIDYAHSLSVYHLDLKPDNILLTDRWLPAICDWGNSGEKFCGGTFGYQAPELLKQTSDPLFPIQNKAKLDSYALGVVIHQMLKKSKPFTTDEIEKMEATGKLPVLPTELTEAKGGLYFIINKLIQEDPGKRWTPKQAMDDKYFQNMRTVSFPKLDISKLDG